MQGQDTQKRRRSRKSYNTGGGAGKMIESSEGLEKKYGSGADARRVVRWCAWRFWCDGELRRYRIKPIMLTSFATPKVVEQWAIRTLMMLGLRQVLPEFHYPAVKHFCCKITHFPRGIQECANFN